MDFISIVLDVGNHMFDSDERMGSLTQGINTVKGLILKRLFSESKDEVALFLYGTHTTLNNLNNKSSENYKNIIVLRSFCESNWAFLEDLDEKDQRYGFDKGDLLEAITVVADHLVTELRGRKVKGTKRILVISNLEGIIIFEHQKKITKALKKEGIELNIISDRKFYKDGSSKDEPSTSDDRRISQLGKKISETKLTNENELIKILSQLNGSTYSFEDILLSLNFFETKSIAQRRWKANLQISDICQISVVGYIKVKQAKLPVFKLRYGCDITADVERRTTYHLNDDSSSSVDIQDTIKGFKYGNSLIPFSEDDIRSMELSVEKGMKLVGFCDEDHVSRSLLIGDSSMIFVSEDRNSEDAFTALVHAMFESHAVAIVRQVYSCASSPRLGILSPRIENNLAHFIYCEIAFGEDIRSFTFPTLTCQTVTNAVHNSTYNSKTVVVTDSQLKATDSLIDSLMLVNKYSHNEEETEEYKPSATVSPYIQMFYQSCNHRYFNPNERLPKLNECVLSTLEPLKENQNALEICINMFKTLFPLRNKMDGMMKKKHGEDIHPEENGTSKKIKMEIECHLLFSLGDIAPSHVTEVGALKPIEDFQDLLSQGEVSLAISSMQARIWQFINDSYMSTLYPKAVQCLHELRHQIVKCSQKEETLIIIFNEFLENMKQSLLLSPSQTKFWNLLKKEKICLIGYSESDFGCPDSNNVLFFGSKDYVDNSDELKEEEMDTLFEDM